MRIAVIGAGVMGSGMAQVLAQAGNEVQCTDIGESVLEQARTRVTTGRYADLYSPVRAFSPEERAKVQEQMQAT